jgi:hypothetical protein
MRSVSYRRSCSCSSCSSWRRRFSR